MKREIKAKTIILHFIERPHVVSMLWLSLGEFEKISDFTFLFLTRSNTNSSACIIRTPPWSQIGGCQVLQKTCKFPLFCSLQECFYGIKCCLCEQRRIWTIRTKPFSHRKCLKWTISLCNNALRFSVCFGSHSARRLSVINSAGSTDILWSEGSCWGLWRNCQSFQRGQWWPTHTRHNAHYGLWGT